MTRKLLHKTQKTYLIYSIVTFLTVSPVFYFATERLYLDDADETLILNKQRFNKQILPSFKIKDIITWNTFNPDNQILKNIPIQKDSIFSAIEFSELENEDEPYRVMNSSILIENKPFLYTNKLNLVESEDLLVSIAVLFIILISILLIGILIITNQMSKQIWAPFYNLIIQIENFEIDKDSLPIFKPSNIEEFNRLNLSVKNLIRKNIVIYDNQREFIDNAAHELQTPLAVFRSKLDLLIQRNDLTQGQAEIIDSINNNINKLIKLNKNLLLLSKIDRQKQLEVEEFYLKPILEKQIHFFKSQSNKQQIKLNLKVEEDVFIKANKSLTETLLNNLFLNAIQHNIENGLINIKISQNKVSFENTSDAPEIPKEKLFNRFAKSNKNQKGNGLGLAIIKKISNQHKWKLTYSCSNKTHLFTVLF